MGNVGRFLWVKCSRARHFFKRYLYDIDLSRTKSGCMSYECNWVLMAAPASTKDKRFLAVEYNLIFVDIGGGSEHRAASLPSIAATSTGYHTRSQNTHSNSKSNNSGKKWKGWLKIIWLGQWGPARKWIQRSSWTETGWVLTYVKYDILGIQIMFILLMGWLIVIMLW